MEQSSRSSKALFEICRQYFGEDRKHNDSLDKGKLLSVLYQNTTQLSESKDSDVNLVELIKNLTPNSAGEQCYSEFVAFYMKLVMNSNSYDLSVFLNLAGKHTILRVLDLFIRLGRGQSTLLIDDNIDKIMASCTKVTKSDTCIHTIFSAFILLYNDTDDASHIPQQTLISFTCNILADAQKYDRRSFSKYIRGFTLWYLEGEVREKESIILFGYFLKSSADLMTQSSCKEIISVLTDTILNRIAIGTNSTTKQEIDSIIEKILFFIPLPISIEVLTQSLISSKQSKIRIYGLDCVFAVLDKICHQRDSSEPVLVEVKRVKRLVGNCQYRKAIEAATAQLEIDRIKERDILQKNRQEQDYVSFGSDNLIHRDTEITIQKCISCFLDEVMLDPIDSVRLRALGCIQDLPVHMIGKETYRVLILKCRDKAVKVRQLSFEIIVELGGDHANQILTKEELITTTRHFLQISSLIPVADVLGGDTFINDLVFNCIGSAPAGRVNDGGSQSGLLSSEGSTGNATLASDIQRTCESLQLHVLPVQQSSAILDSLSLRFNNDC